jgi:hypothetical protein
LEVTPFCELEVTFETLFFRSQEGLPPNNEALPFYLLNRRGEFRNMTGGQFAIKQIATQDRLLPLCPLLWIADQAKPLNLLFNAGQRFSQGCCKDRVRSGLRTCGDTTDIKLRLCLFC